MKIPNIIDFCYGKKYLNLKAGKNGFTLYPLQEAILKSYYNWNYKQLLLPLGRRSGKDILLTIIALYEAYKNINKITIVCNTDVQLKIIQECKNDLLSHALWSKEQKLKNTCFLHYGLHEDSDGIVILNEFAYFKNENDFKYLFENDKKVIVASSPRKGSLFDKLCNEHKHNRLVLSFPTWVINPRYSYESLRQCEIDMTYKQFISEFGANVSPKN